MKASTRDRLVLPILMPIGILVLIAAVLFGFSRILLSISHDAATATALVVAFGIMVISGIVAARAVVKPSHLASMVGAIAGVAMLAGGVALITLAPATSESGGPAATLRLVAKNIAFDQTKLTAPAGQAFAIAFDNQDAGVQHNVQIFDNKDFSGSPVFDGELTTGPEQVTYEVPALDAGTYYFRCVVHPAQMTGELDVVEGGGGGGGGGRRSDRDRRGPGDQVRHVADRAAGQHPDHDPIPERRRRYPAQHRDLPQRAGAAEPAVPR